MKFKFLVLILVLTFLGISSRFYQVFSQETPEQSANFLVVVKNEVSKLEKEQTINGKIIKSKIMLEEICPIENNKVAKRVFAEYGAIFIAEKKSVRFPTKCIFENEYEVLQYQYYAKPITKDIGGTTITLQEPAMDALLEAIKEAKQQKLRITPRGGSIAASRSYQDTARLWDSRFYPALDYWVKKGKISLKDAENAKKSLSVQEQVAKVLEWEDKGLYFSKDLSKSILFSVAAPGASQHIFMLALDVEQFANKEVRKILANHGWFQTVKSDLPHFTFLGVKKTELRALGLKPVPAGGQIFWIPNIVEARK